MALNDLQCLLDMFHPADPISMGKYFVNLVAKRPDLWNNSLTAVPHAMHKKVIEKIGYDSLIIPPFAQMKAILEGIFYYSGRLCRCHKNKSSTPRATWICKWAYSSI